MMDRLQKIKAWHEDFFVKQIRVGAIRKNVEWLIETVEQQQIEIERLRIVEQAYEGMKKAL